MNYPLVQKDYDSLPLLLTIIPNPQKPGLVYISLSCLGLLETGTFDQLPPYYITPQLFFLQISLFHRSEQLAMFGIFQME